ncbi:MAG: class I SAM-dependent methyltransferase [Flavobacteriales bacterium]|jgi:cyclopropane fatty-acyl-phospholipid synthase-like methyltransferase|nr:class I SAM-dependent methyltransferase [Flavobacteriales bacterium]
MNKKEYWDHIYQTKAFEQVGWYQKKPKISLDFFEKYQIKHDAHIIDIGGGDSFLVDFLLEKQFKNISVLDISSDAIARAQKRLDNKSNQVNWIVENSASFHPSNPYDAWHDRASFHFLTEEKDITNYVNTVKNHLKKEGYFFLGTFSEQGPTKCSGLPIKQYSIEKLQSLFEPEMKLIEHFGYDHITPSGGVQNYVFACFKMQ